MNNFGLPVAAGAGSANSLPLVADGIGLHIFEEKGKRFQFIKWLAHNVHMQAYQVHLNVQSSVIFMQTEQA